MAEKEPDESVQDWLNHPVTARWKASYSKLASKLLPELLAKAYNSSDVEVRGLALQYREALVLLTALEKGPRQ